MRHERHYPSFSDIKTCICGLPMKNHPKRTATVDPEEIAARLSKQWSPAYLKRALELATGKLVTFRSRETYNASQRRLKASKRAKTKRTR